MSQLSHPLGSGLCSACTVAQAAGTYTSRFVVGDYKTSPVVFSKTIADCHDEETQKGNLNLVDWSNR